MFVAVGFLEGIVIMILCGTLIFFGSRTVIRRFFKNQPSKRGNAIALLASIFLNPATIFMLIGAVMYYSPRNQEVIKMKLEYEKRMLDQTDQEFTEELIIGKTKGEILERFGRATDTTDTTMVYDYSTLTNSLVVEIELEDNKAVRIIKKRK